MTDEFVWTVKKAVVAHSEALHRHLPVTDINTNIFSCAHGNQTDIEPAGRFHQIGHVYLPCKP